MTVTEDEMDGTGSDAPAEADADRTRGGRRWLPWVLVVVAVAMTVAAVVWGLSRSADAGNDAEAARDVAERFGVAYLSFDSDSVNAAGDKLLAVSTERFAAEFADSRLPGVESLFSGTDTRTRAEVTDTFLSSVDGDRVRALVVVDIAASTAEGDQRLENLSFVLEMIDGEDGWRVDAVTPAPFPEVVGGPEPTDPQPGSTTTTSTTPTDPAPTTATPPAPTNP
ncbi:MAG: hypothetical protein Q8K58_14570 [Acidimicrobiales bacterium]|nr:hypothetical protein [Acidimicrobiales bacterium]